MRKNLIERNPGKSLFLIFVLIAVSESLIEIVLV